ncbi:hypothetical protein EWM62_13205 [Mucilaginibacter terrigena]|uniref:Uncharacterized protein n=1 Tax=Mucilaginibacter terrigena TaxID=2492395 RepID=A0A4V1ZBK9_9SPHI|nr:hypothetical protein [Mucilaginibacter terrigena]RYU89287.1 hypothetical protein EWM62_13205 [Mucilaginibacter terrigena]
MGSFVYLFIGAQSNSFSYSLKVWLTSVVVGPLIYFGATNLFHCYDDEFLGHNFIDYLAGAYMFIVLFSAIFSLTTWISFYFLIRLLVTRDVLKIKYLKYLIALIGVLLTVITFSVMPGFRINADYICITFAYCFCIAGCSYFYKLEIMPDENT